MSETTRLFYSLYCNSLTIDDKMNKNNYYIIIIPRFMNGIVKSTT